MTEEGMKALKRSLLDVTTDVQITLDKVIRSVGKVKFPKSNWSLAFTRAGITGVHCDPFRGAMVDVEEGLIQTNLSYALYELNLPLETLLWILEEINKVKPLNSLNNNE